MAVVDCGAARMSVGGFTDDAQRTLLATLLAHCRPAEVVGEKGALSAATFAAIKRHRSGSRCHQAQLVISAYDTAQDAL